MYSKQQDDKAPPPPATLSGGSSDSMVTAVPSSVVAAADRAANTVHYDAEKTRTLPLTFSGGNDDPRLAQFSDVTLYIGSSEKSLATKIAAHRLILAARSPVFEKLLFPNNSTVGDAELRANTKPVKLKALTAVEQQTKEKEKETKPTAADKEKEKEKETKKAAAAAVVFDAKAQGTFVGSVMLLFCCFFCSVCLVSWSRSVLARIHSLTRWPGLAWTGLVWAGVVWCGVWKSRWSIRINNSGRGCSIISSNDSFYLYG